MNTLHKSIKLLTANERRQGLYVLALVIGMALLETVGVASVMPFLAVLGTPEMIKTNPVLNSLFRGSHIVGVNTPDQFLIFLGASAFVLILFSAIYRTVTQYFMNRFIEMRRHSIGVRLLESYLRQPYEYFLNRHSGDMSKTILSEVDQLIHNVIRPAYNMLAYSIVLIAITTLLILINPILAFITAGVLGGLYTLFYLVLSSRLRDQGGILVTSNKERFTAAAEVFGGIKDIKLMGRELGYLKRFQSPSERYAATLATNQTLNQVPYYLIEAMAFGGIILISIFMLIGDGDDNGELGGILPILGLYAFAAYRIKPAVQNIFQGFTGLRFGRATVDNLYADIDQANSTEQLPVQEPLKLRAQHTIALDNLTYTYPNAIKPALNNLNIVIPVGSSLGIVGSTGAGKTTFVDVILGLLRPELGAITVDGKPVGENILRDWQRSLGYVPQDIFLTDATVAENIALGVPTHKIDIDQVENCASMAQVSEFILNELPYQYETLVGERGVRLSGGQRQRIGIARALYHNPEVLLFDEATSALDSITEKAVMEAIDALAQQKTIILIAHRLSTVRNCNQILLLDQGVIKAKGTFEELSKGSDEFRAMAGKQLVS
jgi:ABC-type multidrug transport system fused ATPase/permease subunit